MTKTKQAYSIGSNIAFAIKAYWQERKSLLFYALIGILARVGLPFVSILMPKLVIDALTNQVTVSQFCAVVGGMSALLMVLHFLKGYTDVKIENNFGNVGSGMYPTMGVKKYITMDYELMELPDLKKHFDKATSATAGSHTFLCNLPQYVCLLTVDIIGLALYAGIISAIHPAILVLLALSAILNWAALSFVRGYEERTRENRAKLDRKIDYVNNLLNSRDMAKDMRMYSMTDWLMQLAQGLMYEKSIQESKVATRSMLARWGDGLLILLRDGAAYALLIYLFLQGKIDLGSFVLTFAAIGGFAGWILDIILQANNLFRASSQMSDLRTYLDWPDKSNIGIGAELPPQDQALEIRLENVSYTYPGAEHPALQGISLTIKAGERIAVVGVNGAGKTTLIKLICGLYRPQTGRILLAGRDITEYNRDEYFSLLSAVFQDIHLLTTSIAENISQKTSEQTDRDRVMRCIERAGIFEKVNSLPSGMDTLLVRQVNDDGIELSGGEKQKLALARALYKDAPVMILDEPTAALDPIAESEVYRQYAELTHGKTSIYISHRLASTRFCDRVLLLSDQTISEAGTHDELIRQDGKYAAMFKLQASYYADDRGEGSRYA